MGTKVTLLAGLTSKIYCPNAIIYIFIRVDLLRKGCCQCGHFRGFKLATSTLVLSMLYSIFISVLSSTDTPPEVITTTENRAPAFITASLLGVILMFLLALSSLVCCRRIKNRNQGKAEKQAN